MQGTVDIDKMMHSVRRNSACAWVGDSSLTTLTLGKTLAPQYCERWMRPPWSSADADADADTGPGGGGGGGSGGVAAAAMAPFFGRVLQGR